MDTSPFFDHLSSGRHFMALTIPIYCLKGQNHSLFSLLALLIPPVKIDTGFFKAKN